MLCCMRPIGLAISLVNKLVKIIIMYLMNYLLILLNVDIEKKLSSNKQFTLVRAYCPSNRDLILKYSMTLC